jgi:hypothetical protein
MYIDMTCTEKTDLFLDNQLGTSVCFPGTLQDTALVVGGPDKAPMAKMDHKDEKNQASKELAHTATAPSAHLPAGLIGRSAIQGDDMGEGVSYPFL